jgi:1-acyl-sn-glycerol-3-phosphate acyltransferase
MDISSGHAGYHTVMGIALSLSTVLDMAQASVATVADSLTGKLTRERVDDRAHRFAAGVVGRARMQLTVEGQDRVPKGRAYVYMSNHQSHMDIPVLYHVMPSPTVRAIGKQELFRMPVFGQAMRAAEFICIDRSNREAAIASLRAAGDKIREGVSIWIAPEGTRSRSGAVGPLKKGGFHLALETGTPIVPIAISGTRNVLPAGGKAMTYDVPVHVTIGAPIPVEGRDVDGLMAEVSRFLHEHVRR